MYATGRDVVLKQTHTHTHGDIHVSLSTTLPESALTAAALVLVACNPLAALSVSFDLVAKAVNA